jgi:type II secretory pathway component PulJ
MRGTLKRQLLAEEKGFTLTEVLVTMMMMIIVLFALYSIFDMGMRVFSFGNNKVEAVGNARLGLEKMEREMRAAYPYNKATNNNQLFWVYNFPTTPQVPPNNPTAPGISPGPVTFGNNLNINNSNYQILGDEATESISYYLQNGMLMRSVNGNGQEVAGPVPAGGFEVHSYSSATGTGCPKEDSAGDLVTEAATEASINVVCVRLTIDVKGRSQTLTADVALRNRGQ